jgi:hypothetical protein
MTAKHNGEQWRGRLRREVALLVLMKLAALLLLWLVFFSPSHRQPADAARTGAHLGLPASQGAPASD